MPWPHEIVAKSSSIGLSECSLWSSVTEESDSTPETKEDREFGSISTNKGKK